MKRALVCGWAMVLAATGCTTVRVAQKDGCWMRRTEKWLSSTKEEVGPCLPPTPAWSEDRLTRMMQECVVRADYRWQSRALEAWERGDNLPERASLDTVLQQCLSEPTRAVLAENDVLRKRLEDMTRDGEALRSSEQAARSSEQAARQQLVGSYEKIATKMTDYLGSAANKAQAPASATATASSDSKGSARTASEHDAKTSLATQAAPAAPGTVVVTTAPPAAKKAAGSSRPAAAASPAQPAPACGPTPACASTAPCSPPSAAAPAPGAPANAAATAPVPPAAAEGAAPDQRAQAALPQPAKESAAQSR